MYVEREFRLINQQTFDGYFKSSVVEKNVEKKVPTYNYFTCMENR